MSITSKVATVAKSPSSLVFIPEKREWQSKYGDSRYPNPDKERSGQTVIQDVPPELLSGIFCRLKLEDLISASQVCKVWHTWVVDACQQGMQRLKLGFPGMSIVGRAFWNQGNGLRLLELSAAGAPSLQSISLGLKSLGPRVLAKDYGRLTLIVLPQGLTFAKLQAVYTNWIQETASPKGSIQLYPHPESFARTVLDETTVVILVGPHRQSLDFGPQWSLPTSLVLATFAAYQLTYGGVGTKTSLFNVLLQGQSPNEQLLVQGQGRITVTCGQAPVFPASLFRQDLRMSMLALNATSATLI